jgi:thymidylate kinase
MKQLWLSGSRNSGPGYVAMHAAPIEGVLRSRARERKRSETDSHVQNLPATVIEALRSIAPCTWKLSDVPFPAAHWKVEFEHLEWAHARSAADILHSCGYQAISARQLSDTPFLIFARCREEGFESIAIPVPFSPAADALLRCPRGLCLALFGPDGVGKSSLVSAIVGALGPLFDHQRTMRWRPQLVSSRIAKEPHKFSLPHSAPMYGPILSMAKLTGAFADFLFDHVTLTRNLLRGSSLIVWDRYFHDLAADSERYRYRGPRWYSQLLLRWLPLPEHFLGIVLDADEDVILSRKAELPFEELRRQRLAYRQLAARLPTTHVLRNDGEIGLCVRQVLSLVTNAMATWFEPIAGAVLRAENQDRVLPLPENQSTMCRIA